MSNRTAADSIANGVILGVLDFDAVAIVISYIANSAITGILDFDAIAIIISYIANSAARRAGRAGLNFGALTIVITYCSGK